MTVQELMEKRNKMWDAAKKFVDTHENENGILTEEEYSSKKADLLSKL